MQKRLPIGIENFERIIEEDYYYVDKTNLIKDIIDKGGLVNLFNRPRRFGKTLNMSMLRYFFEKPIDGVSHKHIFEGLNIASAGEQYTQEQEQYPVINITLKSAKQPTYALAYRVIKEDIIREFDRHSYVLESPQINERDKEYYKKIQMGTNDVGDYIRAFAFLSECLYRCHEKKVIILIDEYDVPLENAYFAGFYDEMISFIRSLFESALKTNDYLNFAVITGCLRISKESVFTGLNNLRINSITTIDFSEYFGFEENEVFDMLAYYDRISRKDDVKRWYDGYLFGNTEVYNPWSVINFMRDLLSNEHAFPTAAWANSSSNSIVRDLIYEAEEDVRAEIQDLIDGKTIEKQIHEDITYGEMHDSEDNLWNFLFFTGYLKLVSIRFESPNQYATLAIPNIEVQSIYTNQIQNWFRDEIKSKDLSLMKQAAVAGDAETLQKELQTLLQQTISYMDNAESFYHGFLLGVLANTKGYRVKSNREAGNGRYDIAMISNDITKNPVILELKVSKKFTNMEQAAKEGLQQIKDRGYAIAFAEDGYQNVVCYGIGFFRKQLRVVTETINIEHYID